MRTPTPVGRDVCASNRSAHCGLVTLACVAFGVLRAQSTPASAPWSHPRTAWGDPDLEGAWTSDNNFSIPLERPVELADKEFLDGADLDTELAKRARLIAAIADGGAVGAGPSHCTRTYARSRRSSLIIDPRNGRLPALMSTRGPRVDGAGGSRRARPADSWEDLSLWDRCITRRSFRGEVPDGYTKRPHPSGAPATSRSRTR